MPNSASLRLIGLNALRQTLMGVVDEARRRKSRWWVGSVTIYAPFHEFGTVRLPPRPFFRPAQRALARRAGGVAMAMARESRGAGMLQLIVTSEEDGYVARLSFELERLVKQWIRIRGLIDTGNMRASFVAAPTLPEMKRASREHVADDAQVRLD